ncbi:MAG: hypothetical protein ACLFWG_04030, partial [Longimicrobiales bacterium]
GVSLLMGEFAPEHRFQGEVARVVEAGAERVIVVPVLLRATAATTSRSSTWRGGMSPLAT